MIKTRVYPAGGKWAIWHNPLSLVSGAWYWKDETNTLEFLSFVPTTETKEKTKKGKAIHFQEVGSKTTERFPEKRIEKVKTEEKAKTSKRRQSDKVTLEDVKYVALFLLQNDEKHHHRSFTAFMRNKQLDNFLLALIYYLSYYLEKTSLEKKPKTYMATLLEKKEMAETLAKLEISQKHLAQMYSVLILGLGMADKHHMAGGKKKISASQRDRNFFESFYTFSTCVAWIVFQRRYLTEIEEEIGRILRTSIFNASRGKRGEAGPAEEKRKMTFVEFRKMMARRPAIRSAVNMRSPVLSSLLPSPKEHAQLLFEKSSLHRGEAFKSCSSRDLSSLASTVFTPTVGILGHPHCQFNAHTLLPLVEEEKNKEHMERSYSFFNMDPSDPSPQSGDTQGSETS
ncbi:protein phosphatase 1 regulatory subunit 36 isoform X1 [Ornithorhynchus anatinus]|uniref:Protein phosphatase 1 regulatory subunit 36 n=1 Tax=Ornithorhynchus anatinus TaxID=9258 RepID=F7ERN3_ORNAN|nr:protein phosphatase 1 regulatory subunit 36 isoform X1 [Ornithorhynchus anatinus]